MFAIGTRPDYRLPFTTVVVDQITFTHTHRDRAGFTWQEPITINIHLLAMDVEAIRPATAVLRCGISKRPMSVAGLGCVKTPKLNLRTEISSRLQSI
jgi:hypothetical protein